MIQKHAESIYTSKHVRGHQEQKYLARWLRLLKLSQKCSRLHTRPCALTTVPSCAWWSMHTLCSEIISGDRTTALLPLVL